MKLYFYSLTEHSCEVIPAPPKREWMDAFTDKHAYRCLPLAIANNAGWQILCPCDLEVDFTGGMKQDDIQVKATDGFDVRFAAESNFTRGILTFLTNFIFQTEPGWQLLATGPLNEPRDGLYPLTGIIETDWLPYTFTMNWQLTRAGRFAFKKGEPFCQIIPIPKNYLEAVEPELHRLEDNPTLQAEKERFQKERAEFRARLEAKDEEAVRQGWQRYYFRGQMPTGTKAPESHVNRLRLAAVADKRGTPVESLFANPANQPPEPARAAMQAPAANAAIAQQKLPRVAEAIASFRTTLHASKPPQPKPQVKEAPVMTGKLQGTPGLPPEQFPAIMSAADTDEIFYLENFLSPEQCREVIDAFERNLDRVADTKDEFFKDRVMWMNSLRPAETRALAIMQQARHASSYLIAKFFKETERLYDDMPQIVKWWPGMAMPAHADNEHPDGSHHNTPWRKYAGVTFLNGDYEGGNFYLDALGLRVPAKPGLLVGFKGDMSHFHGVTKVISGMRYTMPMWLSTKESDPHTIFKVY